MKFKNQKLIKVLVVIVLAALFYFVYTKFFNSSEYKKHVSTLDEVKVNEVNDLIDKNEDFVLYVGRETCPACVEFVPLMSEIEKNYNIGALYLDSINTDKDEDLKNFRDKNDIIYVPALLIYKEGEIYIPKIAESYEELEKILNSYDILSNK